jgi:hypothetical protein
MEEQHQSRQAQCFHAIGEVYGRRAAFSVLFKAEAAGPYFFKGSNIVEFSILRVGEASPFINSLVKYGLGGRKLFEVADKFKDA